MDHHREKVRLELAQLVNDQADAMEKKTLTPAERRDREKRQKQIHELCDELRRIATERDTRTKQNDAPKRRIG
jgi:hypothetical protein